jgi:hypothetical protein
VQRGSAVVSSVGQVKTDDLLDVRVNDGVFPARAGAASAVRRRRAQRSVPDAQAPLFTMPEDRS